jgi:hypothetical protein
VSALADCHKSGRGLPATRAPDAVTVEIAGARPPPGVMVSPRSRAMHGPDDGNAAGLAGKSADNLCAATGFAEEAAPADRGAQPNGERGDVGDWHGCGMSAGWPRKTAHDV